MLWTVPAHAQRGNTLNCSVFPNQAAAQATLSADPPDPHRLDTDRAGIAVQGRLRHSKRQTASRWSGG
jgi:hypothetical protein